jgi:hypothetical protein
MVVIRALQNPFRGINPYLHSQWQAEGGWNNFHNPHITYLATALRTVLRPLGYVADIEDSLQVRRIDDPPRSPKSDLTIYDLDPVRSARPALQAGTALSGIVLPLADVLDLNPVSEKPYSAVAIYRQPRSARIDAKPVAWIELLSPTNKLRGSDHRAYLRKRTDILDSGIVFVELDYLHETPPTLPGIPDYSAGDAHSSPYRILIFDPRPDVLDGWASINEFAVNIPVPEVIIPLDDSDTIAFDFDTPYQRQFVEMQYGLDEIDYSTLPVSFGSYALADQQRILEQTVRLLRYDVEASDNVNSAISELEGMLERLKN